MTSIIDTSLTRRVHVHADGSSTVLTWNNRKQTDEREDHPPERLGWVTSRYCSADRPHVQMLDLIEAALPPLPGWALCRFHYSGFAVLTLRWHTGEELVNVMLTAMVDEITVADRGSRQRWRFDIVDAEGVNECLARLAGCRWA